MTDDTCPIPRKVKAISVVLFVFAVFALLGSAFMWGEGFILSFPPGADYRYPVADLLVNVPATLVAAVGLWKARLWGWAAAQFVAGFYVYAQVEILVEVAQGELPVSAPILVPVVLATATAAVLVLYLWRVREVFVTAPQGP